MLHDTDLSKLSHAEKDALILSLGNCSTRGDDGSLV